MSKIIKPLATTIISRTNSADEHKHRIMNNFLPAVIQITKMAGMKVADNINRALGSKQYTSALMSLAQNAEELDEHNYLPASIRDTSLETMRTQVKSFDKILKIRLFEMSTASSSFLSAIIKEFRLQVKEDIEEATDTMGGIESIVAKVEQVLRNQRHDPELKKVFVLFSLILALLIGIYMTQRVTCDSIVTFLKKEAVLNARLGDLIPRPINAEGDLSTKTTKMAQNLKKS